MNQDYRLPEGRAIPAASNPCTRPGGMQSHESKERKAETEKQKAEESECSKVLITLFRTPFLISVIRSLLSVICSLLSVICSLLSALCYLLSVVCYLLSVIRSLFSVIHRSYAVVNTCP